NIGNIGNMFSELSTAENFFLCFNVRQNWRELKLELERLDISVWATRETLTNSPGTFHKA
ncbi:MAG: hypothetical protein ABTQ25_04245, partial [Nitrosomonas ureae]